MKKVLWFSRHSMTPSQLDDFCRSLNSEVEICQVNRTISHANELAAEIDDADILAIVAPIELQAEFLRISNGRPVIYAKALRVLVLQGEGVEPKVTFDHGGWFQLDEVVIRVHRL